MLRAKKRKEKKGKKEKNERKEKEMASSTTNSHQLPLGRFSECGINIQLYNK